MRKVPAQGLPEKTKLAEYLLRQKTKASHNYAYGSGLKLLMRGIFPAVICCEGWEGISGTKKACP